MPDRREALRRARLLNPKADDVRSPLFQHPFFDPRDKLQVKYEMLRSHEVDRLPVSRAAELFGYSRQGFYQLEEAFAAAGMAGLLEKKRGRQGPDKCTPQVVAYLLAAKQAHPDLPAPQLADQLRRERSVELHHRTIEKLLARLPRRRGKKKRPGAG
jgi:transposase